MKVVAINGSPVQPWQKYGMVVEKTSMKSHVENLMRELAIR